MKALDAVDAIRRFYNSGVRLMNNAWSRHWGGAGILGRRRSFFSERDGVYFLVPGTPPPPVPCKILKTNKLIYDYVLDL